MKRFSYVKAGSSWNLLYDNQQFGVINPIPNAPQQLRDMTTLCQTIVQTLNTAATTQQSGGSQGGEQEREAEAGNTSSGSVGGSTHR